MSALTGTWKNGQIILDNPVEWPDGCRVLVEPVEDEESIGMREEDWSNTPEAIDDWVRWYNSLEPLEFTPAEEADLAAWRQKLKEYEFANMHERIEGLFP